MKHFVFTGTLLNIRSLKNSVYGGPAQAATFSITTGVYSGRTTPDAGDAWRFEAAKPGQIWKVTAHYTKTGNLYFDFLDQVPENK